MLPLAPDSSWVTSDLAQRTAKGASPRNRAIHRERWRRRWRWQRQLRRHWRHGEQRTIATIWAHPALLSPGSIAIPRQQRRRVWRTEEAEKVANWSRLGHRALGHLGTVFNHANCIAQLSGNYCHYIRGSESPPRCCNLYEFTQQFSFQCHRLFRQVNWTGVGLCWNGWIFWGM